MMKGSWGFIVWVIFASLCASAQEESGNDQHKRDGAENSEVVSQRPEGVIVTGEGRRYSGRVSLFNSSLKIEMEGGELVSLTLGEVVTLTIDQAREREELVGKSGVEGGLPAPWRNRDLGRTLLPGKVRWQDGVFRVLAAPKAGDERFAAFHLVYLPVEGDCEIQARVVSLNNEDDESYAGIVICDGTTPEHRKALLGLHPHGEKRVNFRRWGYQGGSVTGKELPSLKLPYWLKLVREGYDVTAYHSPDGRRWRMLKVSAGRMRDKKAFVGLAVQIGKDDRLSEAVIDRVRVNGEGDAEAEPMLPHLVLRGGSRLAAEIKAGSRSAFQLGGRWDGRTVTTPQVARLEFFHPLPVEVASLVGGDRKGLLLRSGDFSEGGFELMQNGNVQVGSVLFGSRRHSILDEADCLVLGKVVPGAVQFRIETQSGSVLLAERASFGLGELVATVAGLGEVRFGLEEISSLEAVK